MKVYDNVLKLIGGTPLIRLSKITQDIDAEIFVKMESQNPGGLVKDRLALAMIVDSEEKGLINADTGLTDEIIKIEVDTDLDISHTLAKEEGIFCGISSGANVAAAIELAKRPENQSKTIVTVICDTGERYLSTVLFNN